MDYVEEQIEYQADDWFDMWELEAWAEYCSGMVMYDE